MHWYNCHLSKYRNTNDYCGFNLIVVSLYNYCGQGQVYQSEEASKQAAKPYETSKQASDGASKYAKQANNQTKQIS